MRHASRAAALASTALLFAVALSSSLAGAAHATDSTGGTSAPSASASAQSGSSGQTGGAVVVPSTKGTGGSEYGVLPPKPRVTRKPASHKTAHTPHPHAVPKPKTAAPKPVAHNPALGTPSPAQTASEGAVFPVAGPHSFGDAANRFGAGRTGHIHQGQDVLASEGLEVRAPLAGTIITTSYQAGGAGWYAAEHTGDGLDFFFAHCQAGSLGVSTGETVSAGQAVCKVGQTGDATGPHLHFEVWVGGWQAAAGQPIDPLPYLEAWDR